MSQNVSQEEERSRQGDSVSGIESGDSSAGGMAKTERVFTPQRRESRAASADGAVGAKVFLSPAGADLRERLVQSFKYSRAPLERDVNFRPQTVRISLVQTTSPAPSIRLWPRKDNKK